MRNPVRIVNDNRTSEAALCCDWCGLKYEHYLALRARWVEDYSGVDHIMDSLYAYASDKAARGRWQWKPKDRDLVQDFVELALYELRHPEQFHTKQPEKRDPNNAAKAVQTKRAVFLGMKRTTFSESWKTRYEDIYNELEEGISIAFRKVWQNQVDIDKINEGIK